MTDISTGLTTISNRLKQYFQDRGAIVFAAAAGAKTKRTKQSTCNTGWTCGYACISRKKKCRSALPGQSSDYVTWLSGAIAGHIAAWGGFQGMPNVLKQAGISPTHIGDAVGLGLVSPTMAPVGTPQSNLFSPPGAPAPAPAPAATTTKAKKTTTKKTAASTPLQPSNVATAPLQPNTPANKKAAPTQAQQQPAPAPAQPANRADELSNAIAKKDFAAAAKVASEVYEDAKKLAAQAGKDFYAGIQSGNGGIEDWVLKQLWAERGYDGKPKVVSDAQQETDYQNGHAVAYRAVSKTAASFKTRFDDFKNGDYFAGHGIYGHGTYVAWSDKTMTTPSRSRLAAATSARPYGVDMWRMTWDQNNMNVVKQTDHQAELRRLRTDVDNWANSSGASRQDVRRLKTVLFGDDDGNETSGRLATIQGHDAIALNAAYNDTYMVLLNRSKITVSAKKVKKGNL